VDKKVSPYSPTFTLWKENQELSTATSLNLKQ